MRSVVVVLPASMCAMMPMFRVFSSGYCASTAWVPSLEGSDTSEEGGEATAPLFRFRSLPAVVREGLVGFRHLVSVFSLLHRGPAVVRGVEQLARELGRHALLGAPAGGADEPAHAERGAAVRPNLD